MAAEQRSVPDVPGRPQRRIVNGHPVWVRYDRAGIVAIADTPEAVAARGRRAAAGSPEH